MRGEGALNRPLVLAVAAVFVLVAVVAVARPGRRRAGTATRESRTSRCSTRSSASASSRCIPARVILLYGLMQRKDDRARRWPRAAIGARPIAAYRRSSCALHGVIVYRLRDRERSNPSEGWTTSLGPNGEAPVRSEPTTTRTATSRVLVDSHPRRRRRSRSQRSRRYLIASSDGAGRRSARTTLRSPSSSRIVLDETLDDLRAEPDARRAIIAAYARLERVLAAHGPAAPSCGDPGRVPRARARTTSRSTRDPFERSPASSRRLSSRSHAVDDRDEGRSDRGARAACATTSGAAARAAEPPAAPEPPSRRLRGAKLVRRGDLARRRPVPGAAHARPSRSIARFAARASEPRDTGLRARPLRASRSCSWSPRSAVRFPRATPLRTARSRRGPRSAPETLGRMEHEARSASRAPSTSTSASAAPARTVPPSCSTRDAGSRWRRARSAHGTLLGDETWELVRERSAAPQDRLARGIAYPRPRPRRRLTRERSDAASTRCPGALRPTCSTRSSARSSASATRSSSSSTGFLADGHVLLEDFPGLAKTLAARSFAQVLSMQLLADPVHARPHAVRRDGLVDLEPARRRLRVQAGADLHEPSPRRRDQPRAAEDAGGAARGDAGAPGDDRGRTRTRSSPRFSSSRPRTRSSTRARTRSRRRSSTASSCVRPSATRPRGRDRACSPAGSSASRTRSSSRRRRPRDPPRACSAAIEQRARRGERPARTASTSSPRPARRRASRSARARAAASRS